MNLTAFLAVLNAKKDDLFMIVGVKGKVTSASVADNLVKLVVAGKGRDTVAGVLKALEKVDAAAAGALEVVANGKVIVSAESNGEDYIICKVS